MTSLIRSPTSVVTNHAAHDSTRESELNLIEDLQSLSLTTESSQITMSVSESQSLLFPDCVCEHVLKSKALLSSNNQSSSFSDSTLSLNEELSPSYMRLPTRGLEFALSVNEFESLESSSESISVTTQRSLVESQPRGFLACDLLRSSPTPHPHSGGEIRPKCCLEVLSQSEYWK